MVCVCVCTPIFSDGQNFPGLIKKGPSNLCERLEKEEKGRQADIPPCHWHC